MITKVSARGSFIVKWGITLKGLDLSKQKPSFQGVLIFMKSGSNMVDPGWAMDYDMMGDANETSWRMDNWFQHIWGETVKNKDPNYLASI